MKLFLFCALLALSGFFLASEKLKNSNSDSNYKDALKAPKSIGAMLTQGLLKEYLNSNSKNPLVIAIIEHIYSTNNKQAIWALYCNSKKV